MTSQKCAGPVVTINDDEAQRDDRLSGAIDTSNTIVADNRQRLPANIDIAQAKLPAAYEQAKAILAQCEQIDECKDWANKAEALASYAKMADDDSLRELADRIQARAVRRMGELLKQFDARGQRKENTEGNHGISQREAAARANISPHQQLQASRVANIPEETFEAAIERPKPATVTALAVMGKQTRPNAKPRTKIAQDRCSAFLASLGGLLFAIETLENKPDVITLIVEEIADNPDQRQTVKGLRDRLTRLLKLAQETADKSGATLEWSSMVPCGSSASDDHSNHCAPAPGGMYIAMVVRNGGTFSHYSMSFARTGKKNPKYLGSAKALDTSKEIAQQHADKMKTEVAR